MLKVLVVDDDLFMCQLIRRIAKMFECDTFEAHDGKSAEATVAQVQPELILMDIMMPDQDGYTTCKNLRESGYKGLVVMVSALQAESQQHRMKEVGANGYIQKPLTRVALEPYILQVTIPQ
jgi:DNA-binding response OmpR family regulator